MVQGFRYKGSAYRRVDVIAAHLHISHMLRMHGGSPALHFGPFFLFYLLLLSFKKGKKCKWVVVQLGGLLSRGYEMCAGEHRSPLTLYLNKTLARGRKSCYFV